MGISADLAAAVQITTVPFIGFIAEPREAKLLSGESIRADDIDLTGRIISSGQTHRALPLTGSLCMAVAARLQGSVVNRAARAASSVDAPIRIGMPSGVLVVAATVKNVQGDWVAEQGAFYRTARRLFEGAVYVRGSRVTSSASAAGRATADIAH
jgi:2-methylaconitate cis-trans-isomerase PrpF